MRNALPLAVAVAVTTGVNALSLAASATLDGTLDASYGAPLAVQTQVSNVPIEFMPNPANTSSSRARFQTNSQLSAAYGFIDTTNHKLDLFIAGAQNLGANSNDVALVLALQTNSTGVTSLAGQSELPKASGATTPALTNVQFDTGFAPQALFTFQYNGGIASDYYNLTTKTHVAADLSAASGSTASMSTVSPQSDPFNASHTYGYDQPGAGGSGNPDTTFAGPRTRTDTGAPTYSIAVNNALDQVRIGSGSAAQTTSHGNIPADPGFAGATTGSEYQFNLTSNPADTTGLYYTGGPINISAFLVMNAFSNLTNQVLGPASGTPMGDAFTNGGTEEGASGTDANSIPQSINGDQFGSSTYYSGLQYFTVPGSAVPEPASAALVTLGLGFIGLKRRQSR